MALFNILQKRGSRKTRKSKRAAQSLRPAVEPLESRLLLSRQAILDFDGEWLSKRDLREGGWDDLGATSLPSFKALFDASRPWLDLDGNGSVNNSDADIAIGRIVTKVREHYAPYDLNIRVGDQDRFQSVLTDAQDGDVMVMITGGSDIRKGRDALGRAPWVDEGNDRDEIVWAFGDRHARTFTDADTFISQMAVTISHEMGHAFGLAHIVDDGTDAYKHHIMASGVEDASRNSNFQDLEYDSDVGPQNAHKILSAPDVLGPSARPWAAVLRPGILTLQGSSGHDNVRVIADGEDWTVRMRSGSRGVAFHVDPSAAPDMESINPFSTAISRIGFQGGAGDDYLRVPNLIKAQVYAYGGSGDDTLYGSGGIDRLYGGGDDDVLIGRGNVDFLYGGSGTDTLEGRGGNDWLFGEAGNDTLYGGHHDDYLDGGSGADWLWGEGGSDYLDGGFDWTRDYLVSSGDGESDTVIQHTYYDVFGSPFSLVYEDFLSVDSADDVRYRFHGWF